MVNAGAPNLKELQQLPWEQLLFCTVILTQNSISSYSLIICRPLGNLFPLTPPDQGFAPSRGRELHEIALLEPTVNAISILSTVFASQRGAGVFHNGRDWVWNDIPISDSSVPHPSRL